MTQIIAPSLLACDFLNIENELKAFSETQNLWFHLDIMDGHFVPNLTFGHPIIKLIAAKTKILLDGHFMVSNPEFYIESLKDLPLHNFTFHYEATSVENILPLLKKAKRYFKSVGISIKPNTHVDVLTHEILSHCDLILIMSVEPGFGGQKFIPASLEKIKHLSQLKAEKNYTYQIQIDGGVSDKNAAEIIQAGCDNLVAGSYIFKDGAATYSDKIKSLRE